MAELRFQVQGSSSEPYLVIVSASPGRLIARCTCAAALSGTHCKHRLEILLGTSTAILSGNAHEMAQVAEWLPGSALAAALADVQQAEAALASAKAALAQSKKRLSTALYT